MFVVWLLNLTFICLSFAVLHSPAAGTNRAFVHRAVRWRGLMFPPAKHPAVRTSLRCHPSNAQHSIVEWQGRQRRKGHFQRFELVSAPNHPMAQWIWATYFVFWDWRVYHAFHLHNTQLSAKKRIFMDFLELTVIAWYCMFGLDRHVTRMFRSKIYIYIYIPQHNQMKSIGEKGWEGYRVVKMSIRAER